MYFRRNGMSEIEVKKLKEEGHRVVLTLKSYIESGKRYRSSETNVI